MVPAAGPEAWRGGVTDRAAARGRVSKGRGLPVRMRRSSRTLGERSFVVEKFTAAVIGSVKMFLASNIVGSKDAGRLCCIPRGIAR